MSTNTQRQTQELIRVIGECVMGNTSDKMEIGIIRPSDQNKTRGM